MYVAKADARRLPLTSASVHCVVMSPPFWGLRKYPEANSIGHEPTFAEHLENIRAVFRELRRVLRDDGTVWMEYADSWAGSPAPGAPTQNWQGGGGSDLQGSRVGVPACRSRPVRTGNLQLLPFRVVMALQDDGWYLRSVCIWHKPGAMPESARNRPSAAHSYVFLLTKHRSGYFYDLEAERAPVSRNWRPMTMPMPARQKGTEYTAHRHNYVMYETPCGPALKTVWSIPTQHLRIPHYATFPEELARRCISLGTSARGVCPLCGKQYVRVVQRKVSGQKPDRKQPGGAWAMAKSMGGRANLTVRSMGWVAACTCGATEPVPATVLDPFVGSGTTVAVARSMGRVGIGFDIADEYCAIAKIRRCRMRTSSRKRSGQMTMEDVWG